MINGKEETVLESIKDAFERKNVQTQYSVSGYKIGLYFHEYDLTVEVDEIGRNDTNIDYEIQRQRAIEKDVGCVFIRIDPDKQNFKILKAKNEIPRKAF